MNTQELGKDKDKAILPSGKSFSQIREEAYEALRKNEFLKYSTILENLLKTNGAVGDNGWMCDYFLGRSNLKQCNQKLKK